ncbi:MAG TPA: carbon-nitrogen hydrolase family protein [Solirubrobacteraceae bacterium]|nr:carbon-nitrogen hydrolase family protein [Solirubrobacteraceae bacterium]
MRVAAVQLNSTADKAANMREVDRLTRAAAADGARLIVLPEKWTVLGSEEHLRAGAEPLDGPAIGWARAVARELSIDLVAGSIAERREGHERLSNTAVHVGPDGEPRAVYRKLHMFDVEIEGRRYAESDAEEPGAEIVSSELAGCAGVASEPTSGVGLGLAICYDLRFPELFGALAQRGVRVVALPAAFTLPTTRDHWDTLVCARAIDNQVFVVAANQVGPHPGEHRSGGRSMIVDPWGVVLAQVSAEGPGYAVADLDFERQNEIRRRMPLPEQRRVALYAGERATP